MKQCYKCKETKDVSGFHKNKNKADGLQNYCKSCAKTRNAEYYRATPERNPQRREAHMRARKRARDFVVQYLADRTCVDCGECDTIVLEFDHVRGEKSDNIARMVVAGRPTEMIEQEIAKCEVRCANCHRRVTAQRGGWYRYIG